MPIGTGGDSWTRRKREEKRIMIDCVISNVSIFDGVAALSAEKNAVWISNGRITKVAGSAEITALYVQTAGWFQCFSNAISLFSNQTTSSIVLIFPS